MRTLGFVASSPLTAWPLSTRSGPAWMSSFEAEAPARPSFSRRAMALFPAFSNQTPLPREEAEFQLPDVFPLEMTSPSGAPSGVKNPAFTAAIPLSDFAAAAESVNRVSGPPG